MEEGGGAPEVCRGGDQPWRFEEANDRRRGVFAREQSVGMSVGPGVDPDSISNKFIKEAISGLGPRGQSGPSCGQSGRVMCG